MALPACLQPGLALTVSGSVPPGCMGYLIDDDDSEPVLRDGEFAIIDVNDREPVTGQLFLIEWDRGDRALVETFLRPNQKKDGTEVLRWWVGAYNRPRSREQLDEALAGRRTISCIDGPYKPGCLEAKLIGKVIGVLARDRHTREELMRRRDVARCPAHILASGYGRQEPGYVEPAGSPTDRLGR